MANPQIAAQHPPAINPSTAISVLLSMLVLGPLFIAAVVYGVFMWLRYSLAMPACVVEGLTAWEAIKRSIELSEGSRGRIFVLWLLIYAIRVGLGLLFAFPIMMYSFKHPGQQLPLVYLAFAQVVGFFSNTFIGPIYSTGLTLFYYDQRIRKEGFDIEWMMQAAGLTPHDGVDGAGSRFEQAGTTMSEMLRPSTLGEILDRTAQLYRRNFCCLPAWRRCRWASIVAVGAILRGVCCRCRGSVQDHSRAERGQHRADRSRCHGRGPDLYCRSSFFLRWDYPGGSERAARRKADDSRCAQERAAMVLALPVVHRAAGHCACFVPMAIAGVVAGPLIYLASRSGSGFGTDAAVGFVVFLVGAATVCVIVWLALSYAMGFAACVVEKKPAWESLKRSWKLSQGTRGRIFVLFLLLIALSSAGSMVGYLFLGIIVGVGAAMGNGVEHAAAAVIIAEIVNFVVNMTMQVLLAPVPWIALVLFYFDQRIRTEGYDIEWMMEQAGLSQPRLPPPDESAGSSWPAAPPDTVEER